MTAISLIDISGGDADVTAVPEKTLAAVEAACRDIGFMYITGHGIAPATIERIRNAVVAYFDQPMEQKLRDRISRDNYRGYIPPGFFSANSGDLEADTYEGYKLHTEVNASDSICTACDLYGPNKWPKQPQGLEHAVLDY